MSKLRGENEFKPSPAEGYHIARLGNLIASRGSAGADRNELSQNYLELAQIITTKYGVYGKRDARGIHGPYTPFYEDMRIRPPRRIELPYARER